MNNQVRQKMIRSLLGGAMICEYTDPAAHRALLDPEERNSVSVTLGQLGYDLGSLGEQSVFFLIDQGEPNEEDLRNTLRSTMLSAGPIMHTLDALIKCSGDDMMLSSGAVLDKDLLLMQLNRQDVARSALENALRDFKRGAQAFSSNAAMLDAAFKRLMQDGYLVMDDRDKERYRITGKICYLNEILAFIADCEMLGIDEGMELPEMDSQSELGLEQS